MKFYLWDGGMHNLGSAVAFANSEIEAQEKIKEFMSKEADQMKDGTKKLLIYELDQLFLKPPQVFEKPVGFAFWGENINYDLMQPKDRDGS